VARTLSHLTAYYYELGHLTEYIAKTEEKLKKKIVRVEG